jgi:hypothetical protein
MPKRKELALTESDVSVQRICTWLPPMSPTPTDDCWLASSLAWMSREAQSTSLSQRGLVVSVDTECGVIHEDEGGFQRHEFKNDSNYVMLAARASSKE